MHDSNPSLTCPISYQSQPLPSPLSPAARSVFVGTLFFGFAHLLAAALVIAFVLITRRDIRPGLLIVPFTALPIGTSYLANACSLHLRRPSALLILITTLASTLLSFTLIGGGIISALSRLIYSEDLAGPALLFIIPIIQALWIPQIVQLLREEQRAESQ